MPPMYYISLTKLHDHISIIMKYTVNVAIFHLESSSTDVSLNV